MFNSWASFLGFLAGLGLTIGLLTTPYLFPGGFLYNKGYSLSHAYMLILAVGGLLILAATLYFAGKLIKGAQSWKEPKVIAGTVLIAFNANALYVLLVDLFALGIGMRALVAVLGVPVIYGNLGAVLGKTTLKASMQNIFSGALSTMGAGFIIVALIKKI